MKPSQIFIPRALQNWRLNLGFMGRAKVQLFQARRQLARAAFAIGKEVETRIIIADMENRINRIEHTGLKTFALSLPLMLVEDNTTLLKSMEKHLNKLGFQNIMKFSDPLSAVSHYLAMTDKPRLVVTDQSMPGLLGHELIEEIAQNSAQQPPRFILFSGDANLASKGNPAAKTLAKHQVVYIQKGCEPVRFELAVFEAAIDMVRGVKPEQATILVGKSESTYGNFSLNPYRRFAGRIAHDLNNRLASLGILELAIAENTLAEDWPDITRDIDNTCKMIDALVAFVKIENITRLNNIEDTALYLKLREDTTAREVWAALSPEQRANLIIITDEYLKNGLLNFRDNLRDIQKRISDYMEDPTLVTDSDWADVQTEFTQALLAAGRLNDSATLKGPEAPLTIMFANYYALLEKL